MAVKKYVLFAAFTALVGGIALDIASTRTECDDASSVAFLVCELLKRNKSNTLIPNFDSRVKPSFKYLGKLEAKTTSLIESYAVRGQFFRVLPQQVGKPFNKLGGEDALLEWYEKIGNSKEVPKIVFNVSGKAYSKVSAVE